MLNHFVIFFFLHVLWKLCKDLCDVAITELLISYPYIFEQGF